MDIMNLTQLRRNSIRIDLVLFIFLTLNLSCFGAEAHGETFVGKAVNEKGILEYVLSVPSSEATISEIFGPNTKTVQKWQWIGFGSIESKAPKMILKKHMLRKKRIK